MIINHLSILGLGLLGLSLLRSLSLLSLLDSLGGLLLGLISSLLGGSGLVISRLLGTELLGLLLGTSKSLLDLLLLVGLLLRLSLLLSLALLGLLLLLLLVAATSEELAENTGALGAVAIKSLSKRFDNVGGVARQAGAEANNVVDKAGGSTDGVALEKGADKITRGVQDSITSLEELGNGGLTTATEAATEVTKKAAERTSDAAEVGLTLDGRAVYGGGGGKGSDKSGGSHFERLWFLKEGEEEEEEEKKGCEGKWLKM